MAKLKDLAGLAALGVLGYKLSQGKDKSEAMTGDQSDTLANANRVGKMSGDSDALASANRNMSPGKSAVDDTSAGVLKAISTPKTAPNDQAGNQGVLSSASTASTASGAKKPAKAKPSRGMTPEQNTALANAGKKSKMSSENDALAKANTGASKTTPSSTAPSTATNPKFEMPISKFFKGIRAAGEKDLAARGMKRGGAVKMASGGMTASRRADGIASRGKTRCKMY